MGRPNCVRVLLNIDSLGGENTGVLLGKPLSINYELSGLGGHLRFTKRLFFRLAGHRVSLPPSPRSKADLTFKYQATVSEPLVCPVDTSGSHESYGSTSACDP